MENFNSITEKIINCAFTVSNKLGAGFLEKVYENAMLIELKKSGLMTEQQKPIKIYYDSQIIGEYIADIVVEERIIVELKTVKTINSLHKAQLLNYLKASKLKIGLIINFSKPKVELKRIINST